MLQSSIKLAWRNIVRHKTYSLLNVSGLALGICACVSIFVILRHEFSFDTFHTGKERIYRVMADVKESTSNQLHFAKVPVALITNSRSSVAGLEGITGFIPYQAPVTVYDEKGQPKHFDSKTDNSRLSTVVIAEPEYFDMFSYQWLSGNVVSLKAPLAVVLTEERAKQYFGNLSPDQFIGKQVIYEDSLVAHVSGVIKSPNQNTDLSFTDFISFATLQNSFLKTRFLTDSWQQKDMVAWAFVKLTKESTASQINEQLEKLVNTRTASPVSLQPWLEPLSRMHFNADIIENPIRTADSSTLYGLLVIAVFILLLAIVNFINLSTAQSLRRTKEVGIRKILGSDRKTLLFQLLSETALLTLIAVLLAAMLVNPVLKLFSSYLPKGISFNLLAPSTILFMVAVTVITSLLSGWYPAKTLSSHIPLVNINNTSGEKQSGRWLLRKGLTVFQFTVSLVFIISSIVVASQLKYTREKDPGFKADAIVIVETPRGESAAKRNALVQQLKQVNSISNVALQWLSPMTDNPRGMKLKFNSTDEKDFWVTQVAGNEDFIPLYNIRLLAGRNLLRADSVAELVINESLCRMMGYNDPAKAIGKELYWNDRPYPVVGVTADFHTSSFHDPVTPLCIINRPDRESSLAIKLSSASGKNQSALFKSALLQAEKAWKDIYPAAPFNYRFYDESIALLYKRDQQAAKLINTSMAITIFISCIGLFGLALFAAEKKAKEISIRKILGASTRGIVFLLGKEFILLVTIALAIASPIAWYWMNQWLNNFAYRIMLSWWMFASAGLILLLISFLTISYQSLKAAFLNPVASLRSQ